jgi:uncharacterized protein (TIGR03435 family)
LPLKLVMIALACVAAQGQPAKPAFEVASIKTAVPLGPLGMRFIRSGGPGTHDPSLYRCQNCSLYQVVMEAFGIRIPAKFSAPDWLQNTRFDISAKLQEGATEEAFHSMLQNLLADRFRLAVHREKRVIPVYELTVAKNGPKFKESVPNDAPADDAASERMKKDSDGYPILTPGVTMAIIPGHGRLRSENQNMEWLADMLSSPMAGPVVDATGLKGKYDFVLSWMFEEKGVGGAAPAAAPELIGPDLLTAVQSQLGLRLDERKRPVEVLVVDHIEKAPAEN